MIVVADTTPIFYLARVGRLEILQAIHPRVLVPPEVWLELVEARPDALGVPAIREATWLEVQPVPTGPDPVFVDELDPGEAAAIAWPKRSTPTSS